jgi:ankyrin repeat protein
VRAGGVERVAALLRRDPSLANARDEGTPLVFSLNPEDPRFDEMIRLLVAHGTNLNARDEKGRSLVDLALAHDLTDVAAVLRAHGADS